LSFGFWLLAFSFRLLTERQGPKIENILQLLVTLIKNMSVIIVLAYVLTRSSLFASIPAGKLHLKNKLYLTFIFALFSLYGTLSGIQILGGIANIRDLGPMIAGLLGGPLIGPVAGLIGAVHRYFLGGPTALPCAVSTVIAGLGGGLIFVLRRGQLPGVAFAALFAALMEVLHMALVLLLVRPYPAALDLVKQISLPMVLANSLGMGIFIFIVLNLIKERQTEADKRRIEGELHVARKIQLSIVPKIFPPFPNRSEFDIHAILEPAKEVGGDLYDFFLLNSDNLCFLVGDVSGKGVPASLFMAVTKTLLKARAHEEQTPAQILEGVNNELCKDNDAGMFVTVFLGVLHIPSGRVICSNAGHNLPYILRKDGSLQKLPKIPGIALGVMEGFSFKSYEFTLQREDTFLLYTDGINEAMNPEGELFGEERMEEIMKNNYNVAASRLTGELKNAVRNFAGRAEQSDDITVMALKYHGNMPIRLKNNLSELERLAGFLEALGEAHHVPIKTIMDVNLALDEIFTNIVSYGYQDNNKHCIHIHIWADRTELQIKIEDDGIPFNPLEISEPDLNVPLQERETGGLGIHLVKNLVQDLEYERSNNKNILRLKKIITA